VYFELSIYIERPPADVFRFLRDKDKHPQEEGSPVLLLDKTTPGDPGVGSCYRMWKQFRQSLRRINPYRLWQSRWLW
jgi:uncharacterized protein YndB with AHSA1/START domain